MCCFLVHFPEAAGRVLDTVASCSISICLKILTLSLLHEIPDLWTDRIACSRQFTCRPNFEEWGMLGCQCLRDSRDQLWAEVFGFILRQGQIPEREVFSEELWVWPPAALWIWVCFRQHCERQLQVHYILWVARCSQALSFVWQHLASGRRLLKTRHSALHKISASLGGSITRSWRSATGFGNRSEYLPKKTCQEAKI